MTTVRACILAAAAVMLSGATGHDSIAPLSQYLMRPQTEISLARSAAPPSISNRATILVLSARGYTVAAKGTNGFECLVERPWMQPYNKSNFWNVRFQAPVCYNAAASKSVLLYTFKRTELALHGATKAQIEQTMSAAIGSKTLPAPAPDAMGYMMSKDQYIDDAAKAWYPHVMFYMPRADMANTGEIWGADRLRSPIVYDNVDVMPEPWAQFFIPVSHWSDGTQAPQYSGT